MPNISDSELDKLFQEAGQEMRPEFDPRDWEDMEKRLDKEERRAVAKRAGGYAAAVLLLLSSAAWLTNGTTTERQQLAKAHSNNITQDIVTAPLSEQRQNTTTTNTEKQKTTIQPAAPATTLPAEAEGSSANADKAGTAPDTRAATASTTPGHTPVTKQRATQPGTMPAGTTDAAKANGAATAGNTTVSKTHEKSAIPRTQSATINALNDKNAAGAKSNRRKNSTEQPATAPAGDAGSRAGQPASLDATSTQQTHVAANARTNTLAQKELSVQSQPNQNNADAAKQSGTTATAGTGVNKNADAAKQPGIAAVTGTDVNKNANATKQPGIAATTETDANKNADATKQASIATTIDRNNNTVKQPGIVATTDTGVNNNSSTTKQTGATTTAGADVTKNADATKQPGIQTTAGTDANNNSTATVGQNGTVDAKTQELVKTTIPVNTTEAKTQQHTTAPVADAASHNHAATDDSLATLAQKGALSGPANEKQRNTGILAATTQQHNDTAAYSKQNNIATNADAASAAKRQNAAGAAHREDNTSGDTVAIASQTPAKELSNARVQPRNTTGVEDTAAIAKQNGVLLYNQNQAASGDKRGVASQEQPSSEISPVAGTPSATKDDSLQQVTMQNNALPAGNAKHNADSIAAPPKDSVAVADKEATPADGKKTETAEEKKEKTPARWFLKLPVSPDFSSIDYGKTAGAGINAGLMVEFMPGKHISFSTGAIWSKKIYTWDNPDKTYGGGGGYGTAKASFLDGDCRVLDIPLNVTYYIRPEARTNFFATVGISSYIMLKEMYTYTVWANQQEYRYDEEYTRKNNNWFSMLNLSIGVQHRLSNRFQVQAEPFLKAPVSGVGQGKVNLVSMGAFFTLKFQLNK